MTEDVINKLMLLKSDIEKHLDEVTSYMETLSTDSEDYWKMFHIANGLFNALDDVKRAIYR